MLIEEETGTYTGEPHAHNGYSAGDFKDVPFTWTKLYPPYMTMPTTREARSTTVTDMSPRALQMRLVVEATDY